MSISARMQSQLLQAVTAAMSHVRELPPTEAVVKAAIDCGLDDSHLDTLVRAFNTGHTNYVRTSGHDLHAKVAAFDLADADAAHQQFAAATGLAKQAAARPLDAAAISVDYLLPPLAPTTHQHEKTAQLQIAVREAPPTPTSHREKQAASRQQRQQLAALQTAAAASQWELREAVIKVAEYFRDPSGLPFAQVRRTVQSCMTPACDHVLTVIEKSQPWVVKAANARGKGRDDLLAAPYTLIKQAASLAEAALDATTAMNAAVVEEPHAADTPEPPPGGFLQLRSTPKQASLFGTAGNLLAADTLLQTGRFGGKTPEQNAAAASQALMDPEHEAKMRGVTAHFTMTDLVNNDPIISGFHQQEIADAYNAITQAAPHVANQPLILRPLLRRALQQGTLDTFDVDQLIGTDANIKKRDAVGVGHVN